MKKEIIAWIKEDIKYSGMRDIPEVVLSKNIDGLIKSKVYTDYTDILNNMHKGAYDLIVK